MVLLSALLVSVASQPTDQVVQWRRNPEHLLPSQPPRWCQDGVKRKRLRREKRTRERRSGDVGICGLGVAAAVGGSSLTRKWFPTSGWRFEDASTWTTAVERGWRQKRAWSPFLKYHRTGALFRLCEYDGLVH